MQIVFVGPAGLVLVCVCVCVFFGGGGGGMRLVLASPGYTSGNMDTITFFWDQTSKTLMVQMFFLLSAWIIVPRDF